MKSYEYDAVTWYGDVYCIGCLPKGVKLDNDEVHPVFADSEWDYIPTCCVCGAEHDYINLIGETDEENLSM